MSAKIHTLTYEENLWIYESLVYRLMAMGRSIR